MGFSSNLKTGTNSGGRSSVLQQTVAIERNFPVLCYVPHPGNSDYQFLVREISRSLLTPPAVMPRQFPFAGVLYPRQLFNFVLHLLSNSTRSNRDQCLNQLYFAFELTRECFSPGRNFQLPFRSNSYYFLQGATPFFLRFFPISILWEPLQFFN
jgi:hypothetical protein